MKLIFLDFDGVLNSIKYYKAGHIVYDEIFNGKFDPEAIAILNRIIRKTGAQIVLTADLNIFYPRLPKMLEKMGIYGKIYSVLPITYTFSTTTQIDNISDKKCKQILDFIEKEKDNIESYCVLSSINNKLNIDNFLQTSYSIGLTEEIAQKAIQILNKKL